MATRRRRKPPLQDARELVARGLDKTAELEAKYINSFKGRGVFAKVNFHKGDFVVEYRGELINSEESQSRRRTYHERCAVFMFDFSWQERTWCVDAAWEDESLGRLVNDDHIHPNCRMKKVVSEGKPHLCLFALRDINSGSEITYDYGGTDWPWRKQVEGLSTATEFSEVDTSRTKNEAPQGSSCHQMQVEGLSTATEFSEVDTSRTKNEAPQGNSCHQMQVEGLSTATEFFEVDTSRTKNKAPQGSSCHQMQVEGLSTATEFSEVDTSRTKNEAPQGSSCHQMQVEGLSTATEFSEADTSRTKNEAPQGPSWMQVEGLSTATEFFEVDTSRTKNKAPQGPSWMQVEGLSTATEFSEVDTSRTKNEAPQGSSCHQMQVEGLSTATEFSEADTSRTKNEAPQGPSWMQVEGLSTATEFFEVDTSRTKNKAPQGSSCHQMQVEGLSTATEFFEVDTSRTKNKAPQGPSWMQVEGLSTATEFSEVDTSRTKNEAPQGSSCHQMQVEGLSTATEFSEADTSRTKNEAPQGPSWMQVEGLSTATEFFEVDTSRTKNKAPQGSSCHQMQVEGLSTATEFSEADTSRTKNKAPQGSSCHQMQVEGLSTATEFSEVDTSRTKNEAPQGPSWMQGSDDPELQLPTKKVTRTSLANFTDSDEYLAASRSPVYPSTSFQISSPSSDFEPCLSKEDQDTIPRLRRTKSIQMYNRIQFDSEELFDLTSSDSGEEYIPQTSTDQSDDTDTSQVIELVEQKPRLGQSQKFQDACLSQTKLNSDSSKQVHNRGRSRSRKESDSGVRCKRRRLSRSSCPRTQTASRHSSKQTEGEDPESLSENSTPNLDQNLPDSASSLHAEDRVPDGSLSIPAVCKKDNGTRMYNKKQYCLYCKLGVGKMARHLERAHSNKPDVGQALSFPKGSKERRMHLEHLRNRGNFAHNVEVLNTGHGNLVPRKQPKQDSQAQNFLHCVYCQGFFTRKVLWRHVSICKFKPNVQQKTPGKTRVQALCAFAVPPPPGVEVELWKLIHNMVQDEVYSAVKSDACILEYGEHLYNRLGYDVGKHEFIRQKLRELGRLLVCSRKTTPLKNIEEHIKPANFMHVIQAVRHVAGHDSKTNTYKTPSLALKLGHTLTKISMLVESRANVQKDYSAAKDARTFRRVYETRWNEMISSASLRTLQESRWNAPLLLPFTKDVQTLHSYLDAQQELGHSKLATESSPLTWSQLAKTTLTQVILFNRRRAGEVSKMPLSAYLTQNPSGPQEDLNAALTDLEKKLCQHFRRIEIRGKRGRKVPVLLTPAMQQSFDLLVSKRQECGVPGDNAYFFARPSALTCYRGSDCLRHYAKICGARSPSSLTSTKLRKQTGTLSQVLNLNNTELDQLADFLGHDIRVHRQFYRLPEGTLQLAKVSKVLMALEQGRLAEFKGKTLDEINIDPDENVHLDSDTEAACDSDSEEERSQVTSSQMEERTIPDVSQEEEAQEQGTLTPPQTCHRLSSKRDRGRQPTKRKVWDKKEILAVEKHLMSFITSCRVPGKSDCDKCLKLEYVALKDRNWSAIKFYVKNRITALKRKV